MRENFPSDYEELPYGLLTAFDRYPAAFTAFSSLDREQKQRIITQARAAQSSVEIKSIIRSLTKE